MTRLDDLRDALDALRDPWRRRGMRSRGLVYDGPADFVLRHGESFESIALPDEYEYGLPKLCFGNAIALALLRGLGYVEGYAMGPFGLPIHHAWNVDEEGRLIDVTWSAIHDEEGRRPIPDSAYLGVRFSLGRADEATWHGDATVLDDYRRDWPILREPWTGEDFDRVWPDPSPPLRALLRARSVA